MLVDPADLLLICPKCPEPESYATSLGVALTLARCHTLTRAAAFLGQWAHETGEFRWLTELGEHAGRQYEWRKDLGNTEPGDGPRFKGRGICQLTGRANYRRFSEWCGVDLERNPDLVAGPLAFQAGAWYWLDRNLNELVDKLNFRGLTHAINGGLNGLEQRQRYYYRALEVLGRKGPNAS